MEQIKLEDAKLKELNLNIENLTNLLIVLEATDDVSTALDLIRLIYPVSSDIVIAVGGVSVKILKKIVRKSLDEVKKAQTQCLKNLDNLRKQQVELQKTIVKTGQDISNAEKTIIQIKKEINETLHDFITALKLEMLAKGCPQE